MKSMGILPNRILTLFYSCVLIVSASCNSKSMVINLIDLGDEDSLSINIDLSKKAGEVVTESVPTNTHLKIAINSFIPNPSYNYDILFAVGVEPIPKLDRGESYSVVDSKRLGEPTIAVPGLCKVLSQKYIDAYELLLMAEHESEIPDRVAELALAIHKLDSLAKAEPNCEFPPQDKEEAHNLISKTRKVFDRSFKLRSGERLEVTIMRSRKGSTETKQWRRIYSTGPKGKWSTTYGFSFIPEIIGKRERFFSAMKDSTVFVITKERNPNPNKTFNFAPSIFYSWTPSDKANDDFVWSLSGGLGFDLNNPIVFLGGSVHFHRNLGLIVGMAAHKQKRLRGRYSEGDTIPISLDSSQLHEELYTVNPFLAISFRFNSPPFSDKTTEAR